MANRRFGATDVRIAAQHRPSSLSERVVHRIRQEIIHGRLQPGDHIVEKKLTEMLGVSRTPVREALILLEREGLVVTRPHRGASVRTFAVHDHHQILAAYESRELSRIQNLNRAINQRVEQECRRLVFAPEAG